MPKFNCTDIKHLRAYVSSAHSLRELHFSSFLRRSPQAGAVFLLSPNIEPSMMRSSDGISTEKNSLSEGLNGNSKKWRTAAQRAKWFRKIHDHIQTINHLQSDYTETPDIAPLSVLIPGMHDFSWQPRVRKRVNGGDFRRAKSIGFVSIEYTTHIPVMTELHKSGRGITGLRARQVDVAR